MQFTGAAHRYGRDIDTDVIIPARYLNTSDPAELAKHCMEDLDAGFVTKVKAGDILVAEENFGCGSSREHAPISIKHAGVSVIIAKSFARIFYRNAINTGLPIMESAEAVDGIHDGDVVSVPDDVGAVRDPQRDGGGGVGINVGDAVVGNIGTDKQRNYSAIGDSVNYAKRLQENAKGGQILLSQLAYEVVKANVEVKELPPLQVKGRSVPEPVYEVIGLK